jgi:hypothetical protein
MPPGIYNHKSVDLSQMRFGRLVAQWPAAKVKHRQTAWLCLCDCGKFTAAVRSDGLIKGKIRSCGCLRRELFLSNPPRLRHGAIHTPEYRVYAGAKSRCRNPNVKRFKDWGGRGIQFKFSSFEEFLACVGKRPAGTSIDRIDNDGHYEPGNVRWANSLEQRHNRRDTKREIE